MKRLKIILVSLLITSLYCAEVYCILLAIGFDTFWNPNHYENYNSVRNVTYFLFRSAWVPCILSVITSFFKTKIFSQDSVFYCCGLVSVFYFDFYNNGEPFNISSVFCWLFITGFITIYATGFNIYQLFKTNSQKPEEKLKEKGLEKIKSFKEKEDYQKEYFESLDNK